VDVGKDLLGDGRFLSQGIIHTFALIGCEKALGKVRIASNTAEILTGCLLNIIPTFYRYTNLLDLSSISIKVCEEINNSRMSCICNLKYLHVN
jgi:hypothetical protein